MHSRIFRTAFYVFFLGWGTCVKATEEATMEVVLNAVPAEYAKLVRPLNTLLLKFREEENLARAMFRQQLSEYEDSARASTDPITAKEIITEIQSLKEWIDKGGECPKCDKTQQLIVQFGRSIEVARQKLDRPLFKLTRRLNRDRYTNHAESIDKAYQRLGNVLDFSSIAKPRAVFTGYRSPSGSQSQVPLLFAIEEIEGIDMEGRVEINWSYVRHPVHTISGRYKDNSVEFRTLTSRDSSRKTDHSLLYQGKLYGRVLIGTYSGLDSGGKPLTGSFLVKLN